MVRFLHIADKPFTAWKEDAGRVIPRSAKPEGFWIARDLTWAGVMDSARDWDPRGDKMFVLGNQPPGRVLAAFSHVFAGKPVPAPAEGETIVPLRWNPLFVYELNIPEASFTSDVGAPDRSRILRVSRANLEAFLGLYDAFARRWSETAGPSDTIVRDAIESSLKKDSYDKQSEARIETIRKLVDKKKTPIYEIVKNSEDAKTILRAALVERSLTLKGQREITVVIWRAFMSEFRTHWGGLEFAEDLFTAEGDDPALVARAEIFRRLDAPSAVLFSPSTVLGPDPPQRYLRAVLAGVTARVDAPEGVPVYRFGVTSAGELRVVEPEPSGAANAAAASSAPTGKGRRRTRRRVFKNPKTLKKRIR